MRDQTEMYECIVVGGGPGGYSAAIRLAQRGLHVACVERERVGGVCLNWGCIPSKALIATAARYVDAREGAAFGISSQGVELDLGRAMQRSRGVVRHHTDGVEALLKSNGATLIEGTARILDARRVQVKAPSGESRILEATSAIVMATGARPVALEGLKPEPPWVITAKEAVFLERVPEHLIVLGGGVIGLELGSAYLRLGSKLTVIEVGPTLLPGVDEDLVRVVERKLVAQGAVALKNTRALGWSKSKRGGVSVQVDQAGTRTELEGSVLLVAAGFRPNTEDLGLQEVGVRLDARGHIAVDRALRTSVEGIYAIGDVTGPPYLAHKAFKEAEIVADSIRGLPAVRDDHALPGVIFTEPEIATVGLSESAAKARYGEVEIGRFPMSALGRAMALGKTEGFVKLIAHQGRLVGAGLVGAEAGELISELTLALEVGVTLEDLALTVHPHPTLSEAVGEAAAFGLGAAVHIVNRKRSKSAA